MVVELPEVTELTFLRAERSRLLRLSYDLDLLMLLDPNAGAEQQIKTVDEELNAVDIQLAAVEGRTMLK